MSQEIVFSYKTRGDSNPKGKPRVFFTCHPADLEKYLGRICADLLGTQDCAVYYTDDMSAELTDENALADLGRMNLFVIPVTARLLREKNRAVDSDLPFALARHIPVLPVLLEPGLDADYSRPDRFGELQYLNPYSSDASEIGYAEKLKKYLDSVLISDELAERIRRAFDAYIFLSYRKKDRVHANELMRLIHAQPEFRDIAIWFDEFLTPGESFQENILRVLESSELFALLITPNLLEKPNGRPNYVMGEEYPAALRLGKPVFPAEMVRTDPEALRAEFRDIPSPVDIRSDAAFRERLLGTLKKAAVSASKDDPGHDFLIGLAYLDGIDVEVNTARAVELITGAAEMNHIPAVKKLVSMYSAGSGVERSAEKAVEWQKKAVELLEDAAEKTYSEADAMEVLREKYELGELAFSIEDYETARTAYTGSYEIARLLCFGALGRNVFGKIKVLFKKYVLNKSYFSDAAVYLARACRKLLELAFAFGSEKDITEWAQKSMLLIRTVNAQLQSPATAVELLSLCGKMAEECTASGNLAGARGWLQAGSECWEGLSDDDRTRGVRLAYARLLKGQSEYCEARAERNAAYDARDAMIDLYRGLYRETPEDPVNRYGIVECLLAQAEICLTARAGKTAEELLDHAKGLIDRESGQDDYRVRLLSARYLKNSGALAFARKDCRTAVGLLENSIAVLGPIAEMKFDAEHQRQLAEAAELAGDAYAALGTDTEAEKLHRKAESVLAGLTAVSKQVRDIRDLARVYEKLLEDSIRLRHSTAVTACYEKALWTRRALTEGMRVRTGLRTKDAAELAAGGDADYAAFGADAEALEKLKGRREEIRRLAADCAPEEDRLIDRLQPGETDFAALFAGVKACADAVLREHTVPAIRQDLAYLSRTLGRIVSLGDVFDDPDVSAAQLVRSAKRIAEYIAEHYEPFFKFDENCMLVYAFCRRLYGTLSLKAALGGGTVRAPGPEIGEPVFMNYPVSEIAHEGTWQQLFNWTR